ncbi:GntP family permease [Shewanella xiamenensis]|jgi:GntP family gluconate:H+ symporter|uniref:GntP family permease n=1 Tax=Shewanella TaxID=22 RepID=UPI00002A8366|nr:MULTISPECIES: GntP family permease [Shewanella]PZP34837.1 MAG: GntP family permease [Shewanella oneidensis]ASF14842.1 GntP family permease [Shewanella sp. FDAARGOS_354]MBW0280972.1 gluconate transporter [Shewanella xiamenensis]MBW0297507.1 gluconate transporter [Shewanella xiamenensis]MCH7422746.1 GntP family permease [Shewanella sp. MM_2022_3]
MNLVLILIGVIAFIVIATSKFKLHPFLTLILAAFIGAFAYGLPSGDIAKTITTGFGNILGYIGLVIVLGTIIGIILEKSGAAITMADVVIKVLGKRFPTLTMSIIGYLVSIPVFCDSGFVILNSLKQSMANRMKVSSVSMSVALATGLYATHTFVPPTPGPIAAAGNLGLESNLGLVIGVGLFVAAVASLAGMLWANRFAGVEPDGEGAEELKAQAADFESLKQSYGTLPSPLKAFAPIFVPILLICLGSIANFPSAPLGKEGLFSLLVFLGQPVNALLIGLFLSLLLLKSDNKIAEFSERISQGLVAAAPIILITGAGGAFGAVLKATPIGDFLGSSLSALGVGIFMPFIVAAALKSAQGSSTVALVATSALVAPMLGDIGLGSEMGRVLTVMAIGAGAMTVSHANDSFFWVVTQFSRMSVKQAYKAQTMATLIQGVTSMLAVYVLSLVLL